MKEWKKVKIKDICNTNVDQYSQKENWENVLYLDTGSLTNNVISSLQNITIGKDGLPSRARRKVKHLDILYSTVRPNQRHFGIIVNPSDNMLVSTGFCVIQCIEGKADPYFIYYYLSQNKIVNYLHAIGEQSVSAYPSIKPSNIEDIELKVPDFKEQVRIGKLLSSLDNKIALNKRINDNLEQQAQALYKSWFVDFEPFKGVKFVDSELGEIPEGWRVVTLKDLVIIKYGKDHKKLNNGKIPVYGSGGIMRSVDKFLYSGESVLIPRKGTLNNVFYVNESFWSVDTMFYTQMKQKNIAKYVYFFVSSQNLASMNAGSAVPSMTTDILNGLKCVIAPLGIMNKFEILQAPIFRILQEKREESQKLSELRDSLLPKLMSGELKTGDLHR